MTLLLVDIGNTRVKWSTLRGGQQGAMHAAAHEGSGLALREVVRSAPRNVNRVVVVSVVDEALSHVLDEANHLSREREIGDASVQVYDIPFGGHRIWGATAGMLMAFYRLLRQA